jgi:hypothetical protein
MEPTEGVTAARAVGASAGFASEDPLVLQQTNNVVVWLRPHPVVAKVGRWPHSAEVLAREVVVAQHLAAVGAPSAAPIGPIRSHGPRDLPVSLWNRLEGIDDRRATDCDLAAALAALHAGLDVLDQVLPSFLWAIDLAHAAVSDDERMQALDADRLAALRERFDHWARAARQIDDLAGARALHGEPHQGNVILTSDGPRFLDFEAACTGPLEWDLASMPPGVAAASDGVDHDRLGLLRLLNSARVATWGWAHASDPIMRAHGEHHLAVALSS